MTKSKSGTLRDLLPALPLAALFLVGFVLPLTVLGALSFFQSPEFTELGFDQYRRFADDGLAFSILADTLLIGAEVATLSLCLAYPLGLVYLAAGPRLRTILTFLIMLPLLTSTVVRTFAWIVILGREGIVNSIMQALGIWDQPARLIYTWGGLILALTQIQLPLMALPLINNLIRLDPTLPKAAEGLGASRVRVFFTVILPLTRPGAVAGWLLVFAAASTAFITQSLIGGGRIILMPLYIYQQAVGEQAWPFAAALSLIFTAAVIAVVVAVDRLGKDRTAARTARLKAEAAPAASADAGIAAMVSLKPEQADIGRPNA